MEALKCLIMRRRPSLLSTLRLAALFLLALSGRPLEASPSSPSSPSSPASPASPASPGRETGGEVEGNFSVRLLALFTGSRNDLGLDHRLGRQVLKLAAEKARRLYPELANIELLIHNDDADCANASDISMRVAEQVYGIDHRVGTGAEDELACPASDGKQDSTSNNDGINERCYEEVVDDEQAGGADRKWRAGEGGAPAARLDAILGPSCEGQIDSVARMAAYWRTPIYTVSSIGGRFGRKDVYPTLTRLSPSTDHLCMFIVKVMERFKWRHLAIVIDPVQVENAALLQTLEKTIDQMRYSIPIERYVFPFRSFSGVGRQGGNGRHVVQAVATTAAAAPAAAPTTSGNASDADQTSGSKPARAETGQQSCTPEAKLVLESIRRVARVVLVLLNDPSMVRRLLLCAHELQFNNGEYTFLALNLGFKSSRQDAGANLQEAALSEMAGGATASSGAESAARNGNGNAASMQNFYWFAPNEEENNMKAKQMFESLMVFSVELPIGDEFSLFVDQTLERTRQAYPGARFATTSVSQIAVAIHDSLLLAVEAERRAFTLGRRAANDTGDLRPEVPLLWNERFSGGLMTNIEINANGDQELTYVLSDMAPETGWMRPVASYSREARQVEMLPEGYIHWPARASRPAGATTVVAGSSSGLGGSSLNEGATPNAAGGGSYAATQSEDPPPDEPECGFTGEAERCVDRENMYIALAVVSGFLFAVLGILVMSFKRYKKIKYQMQLDDYWWRISWHQLEFIEARRTSIHSNMEASSVIRLRSHANGGARSPASGSLVSGHAVNRGAGASTLEAAQGPSSRSAEGLGKLNLVKALQSMTSKGAQTAAPVALVVTPAAANDDPTTTTTTTTTIKTSTTTSPTGGAGEQEGGAPTGGQTLAKSQEISIRARGDTNDEDARSRAGSQAAKSSLLECQASLSNIIRSDLSTVVRGSSLALYRDEVVIVKQLNAESIEVTRSLLIELKSMRELSHENLARLVGLCTETGRLASVYEYCSRGNLQDLLLNRDLAMDWNLKYSIIGDILNGLNFIHTTLLDFHGRLKSTNLVLDSRFTVKLTDFGLKSLYNQLELIESAHDEENEEDEDEEQAGGEQVDSMASPGLGGGQQSAGSALMDGLGDELDFKLRRQSAAQTIYNMDSVSIRAEKLNMPHLGHGPPTNRSGVGGQHQLVAAHKMNLKNRGSARFFWTAPEHLRERQPHLAGSRRGDIYSLAIILLEIFTCKEPYYYGTNAKPRWQVIKQDKLLHQQQQQQQQRQRQQEPQLSGFDERSASRVMAGSQRTRSQKSSHSGGGGGGGDTSVTGASGRMSVKQSIMSGKPWRGRQQATVGPLAEHQLASSSRQVSVDQGDADSIASSSSALMKAGNKSAAEQHHGDEAFANRRNAVGVARTAQASSAAAAAAGETDTINEDLDEDQDQPGGGGGDSRRRSQGSASSRIEPHSRLKPRAGGGPGWAEEHHAAELDAEEILDQLRMGVQPEPVRPYIPNFLLADIEPRMLELLKSCWTEQAQSRPSVSQVRNTMRKITKGATAKNYLDNLLDRLQTYASQLERIVDFKSADIVAEKARTEELLYQLVPRFVADKLKQNEPIMPQVFDGVTILFSDIVGFEKYASVMSPCELVDLLNNIYSSFESIIGSFDVTKIEVILDQFLVAAGISLQQHSVQASELQVTGAGGGGGGGGQVVSANAPVASPTSNNNSSPAIAGNKKLEAATAGTKPRRGLLRTLRGGGGQSTTDKNLSLDGQGKQRSLEAADSAQQDQPPVANQHLVFDLDHYKRSSAEQIARMALCIRDLVKSFHFRQNLSSYATAGPAKTASVDSQSDAQDVAQQQRQQQKSGGASFVAANFNIRIGIHSGKVCAGIVGLKRPKFCLIGDTVNVASRMHTNSKASRIQISADTRELLQQVPGFSIEPRGRIEIKGKGLMDTYWLESAY